jgi:hypothetical protein
LGASLQNIKNKGDCMNVINKQNSSAKDYMVLGALGLFFIGVPIGLISVLVYFDIPYVIPAIIAIILFAISAILTIRQKRIDTYSVAILMAGLLFLASSVIELGFGIFTQNMPIHDQIEFSGIMRPNQVSQGLASIGVGFVFILVNLRSIKSKNLLKENSLVQNYKVLSIVRFSAGIFFLLFGIYIFINGLRPL